MSQPFADLIVSGRKTVELRSWNTRHRGHILIHAPLRVRRGDCARFGIENPVTGAILGRAVLADVVVYGDASEVRGDAPLHLAGADFEAKRYGFVLREPVRFRFPVPRRGFLGLFEADPPEAGRDAMVSDIADGDCRRGRIGRR